MKHVEELLRYLKGEGVLISTSHEKLVIDAKPGVLNDYIKNELRKNKDAIITFLTNNIDVAVPKIKDQNIDIGPLTFSQQGLWIIDRLQSGSPEYNMPMAFELRGTFDLNVFSLVLTEIVRRHEVLRTVYVDSGTGPKQYVRKLEKVEINQYDLSATPPENIKAALKELIQQDATRSFDLEKDLMIRASFISLPSLENNKSNNEVNQQGVLLFNMHHISSDGWSMEVLKNEFFSLYRAFALDEASPLPELDIQYVDYAYWQRNCLPKGLLDRQLKYWQTQLENVPSVHSLRLDKPRPKEKQFTGKVITSTLSANIATNLLKLAKHYQLTPFMLLHSTLALLLARHSNSPDIVVGTPVANRMQVGLESLIGFFVNTIALRINTQYDLLIDYFSHVRQIHLDAQAHHDIPFEQVVEALKVPRSTQYTPLFQIMMTTNNDFGLHTEREKTRFKLPGVDLTLIGATDTQAKFDLSIDFRISEAGIGLEWVYDTAIFEHAHIEQLDLHLSRLLAGLSQIAQLDMKAQSNYKLSSLPMLSDGEVHHLVHELNDTYRAYPKDKSIHSLFEQNAKEAADKVAITFEDKQFTYKELNEKANQLARYLIEVHKVGKDTLIGLCVGRSIEMVIGILGILKTGAGYFPIDLANGTKVICTKLASQAIKTVLVSGNGANLSIAAGTDLIDLETFFEYHSNDFSCDDLNLDILSSALAYGLSSSGTTGTPKLIGLAHYSLVNLMQSIAQSDKVLESPHRVLQFSSVGFDMSFTEIFLALLNSGSVHMISERQKYDVAALIDVINSREITLVNLPFSMLNTLSEYCDEENVILPTLQAVISTAERLQVTESIKVLFSNNPQLKLFNHYGPTETNVCTALTLPSQISLWDDEPSIGKPINNTQCLVLSPDKGLTPLGEMGELYVGGDCLALGYIGNEALTQEKFLAYQALGSCKSRFYRTGDLVRWQDGELIYCGRADDQVKIRGFRVELKDIEAHLSAQAGVDSAVVMTQELADSQQLVSYIKLTKTIENSANSDFISELKVKLFADLPAHMIPSIILVVKEWPLNLNGKIDKRALPAPVMSACKNEYAAAETKTERAIVEMWSKLLGIDKEKISTSANFFDLGGHSLLIIKLMTLIKKEFLVEPTYSTLFNLNTARELASSIDSAIIMKKTKEQIEMSKLETEWL